mgnify:CR=1 FL=1
MDTNENCEYEKIKNYRNCLSDWMNDYNWEWFISLNLPNGNIENTENLLKKWRCKMCSENHIQICYVGHIINSKITGHHVHLLMSGKNKDRKTLLDMDKYQWKKEWGKITHRNCDIQFIKDDGVIDYMNKGKNTPHNYSEMVNPYNIKLLKKYRKLN